MRRARPSSAGRRPGRGPAPAAPASCGPARPTRGRAGGCRPGRTSARARRRVRRRVADPRDGPAGATDRSPTASPRRAGLLAGSSRTRRRRHGARGCARARLAVPRRTGRPTVSRKARSTGRCPPAAPAAAAGTAVRRWPAVRPRPLSGGFPCRSGSAPRSAPEAVRRTRRARARPLRAVATRSGHRPGPGRWRRRNGARRSPRPWRR